MSSNVGLTTPRGSGTSGYVQRNLSHLKPRDNAAPYPKDLDNIKHRQRQPDKDILEHDRKREIEVKVFELRDRLEDEGVDEDEVDDRCDALRKELESKNMGKGPNTRNLKSHQVHELAKAKIEESEKLRKALGIREDYEEGSHWKRQDERRLEKERESARGETRERENFPSASKLLQKEYQTPSALLILLIVGELQSASTIAVSIRAQLWRRRRESSAPTSYWRRYYCTSLFARWCSLKASTELSTSTSGAPEGSTKVLFFIPATGESVGWYRPKDAQPTREIPFQGKWSLEDGGDERVVMLSPFMPVWRTSYDDAVDHANSGMWSIDMCGEDQTGGVGLLGSNEELAFSTPPRRFFCDYWDETLASRIDPDNIATVMSQRWERLIGGSEASCKNMLLTHPPCHSLRLLLDSPYPGLRSYEKEDVNVGEVDAGVYSGEFVASASFAAAEERSYSEHDCGHEDGSITVEVVGGELWELCPKSADEMTGWEMLRLFAIGVKRFREEMVGTRL